MTASGIASDLRTTFQSIAHLPLEARNAYYGRPDPRLLS